MNTAENSNCNLTGIHSVKEFDSKANIVLLSLSIFGIVLSSLILLGSTQIFTFLAEFLSEKVFHRDFDIAKWGNTILSLISASNEFKDIIFSLGNSIGDRKIIF